MKNKLSAPVAFLCVTLGGVFYAALALAIPVWFLLGATSAYVAFSYLRKNEGLPPYLNVAAAAIIGLATTWLCHIWYWELSPLAELKESQQELIVDWKNGRRAEVHERINDWAENSHPWKDETLNNH